MIYDYSVTTGKGGTKPVRLSSTKIRQIGIYFRHSRTYLRQAGTWL